MPASQFIGPILETGIQIPHYFNGRLLTATDLKAGQDASNTRQTWFGQSNGYGVANGLEVSSVESDTKLHIAAGIGMNRQGKVIHLKEEISLPPLPPPPPSNQSAGSAGNQPRPGQFAGIKPQLAAPVDVQATGVFLLTVVPTANGYKGSAATQIPAASTVVSSSGNLPGTANQWEVERASLKIIRLAGSDLTELYSPDDLRDLTVNDKNRRNLVAHWCYGTLNQQNLGSDPFAPQQQSGDSDPLDTVADLGESDIPLATFHWDGTKLTFVDMWSVRRRVISPDAASGNWQTLVSDKRVATNQARFLQFQDHLDDIVQQSLNPQSQIDLSKVQLSDYFTFLPPVGFLPTTASSAATRLDQGQGAGGGTGKPGATGGTGRGTPSDWWRGLVSEAGKVAMAIDPLNWLHLLNIGVNTQANQIDALQTQLARLTEQMTALQQRGLMEALQKQLGETTTGTQGEGESQPSSGTPAEGEVGNEPTHSLPGQVSMTEPGSSEAPVQAQVTSERLFHDEIQTFLSDKQQTGPGFDLVSAFTGAPTQLTLIGSDSIRSLLNQSWSQDAIDLRPEQSGGTAAAAASNQLARMLTSFSPKSTNIYLVAQNLLDPTDPVYTIFHNATQPAVLLDTPGGQ